MGCAELLCKEQSQITLFKSPSIRSRKFKLWCRWYAVWQRQFQSYIFARDSLQEAHYHRRQTDACMTAYSSEVVHANRHVSYMNKTIWNSFWWLMLVYHFSNMWAGTCPCKRYMHEFLGKTHGGLSCWLHVENASKLIMHLLLYPQGYPSMCQQMLGWLDPWNTSQQDSQGSSIKSITTGLVARIVKVILGRNHEGRRTTLKAQKSHRFCKVSWDLLRRVLGRGGK